MKAVKREEFGREVMKRPRRRRRGKATKARIARWRRAEREREERPANVEVCYDGYDQRFDRFLIAVARKFNGKQTGSGFSFVDGKRDVGFMFPCETVPAFVSALFGERDAVYGLLPFTIRYTVPVNVVSP